MVFRDPANCGRRFIPLLLADCELPDTLRRYRHVDHREESENAFTELVAACRAEAETEPEVAPAAKVAVEAGSWERHMLAICGEANQIFHPITPSDSGIDGEVVFKDDDGRASGHKVYVQLKSGESHLRRRDRDGSEVFDVKDPRHIDYWASQPVDVFLVVRTRESIRWMNLTRYLKTRADRASRQIVFEGERLDATAVWRLRDRFIPPGGRSGWQRAA